MTKFTDKHGVIIHEIDDGKNTQVVGRIQPKWRRFYWPIQLKYIYDEFMRCAASDR